MSSVINEAHARRNFFIERPRLGMELSYEFEQDERKGSRVSRRDYTSTYTEELDIRTRGWVYHPALLAYKLEISPTWEQIRDTNSDVKETRSFLSNYFAELEFLQYKPYSLTLNGSRDTTTVRSSFAERTRSTDDTYNAIFSLKYPVLPTELTYTHVEGSQTGFFEAEHELDQVGLTMRNESVFGESILTGTYKDVEDTIDDVLKETYFQSAELNSNKDFTGTNEITLNSQAFYEESDSTDILLRRYSIYENFSVLHTENLETSYNASYEKDNRYDKIFKEPFRSEVKSAAFGLNHRLYNNLSTNVRLTTSESNNRVRRNSIHDGRIDWNYRRGIPVGILNTNVGYNYTIRDQKVTESEDGTVWRYDEQVTLVSFIPSDPLGRATSATEEDIENIVVNSIKVSTDTFINNFGFIYEIDRDYRVIKQGKEVRIARTAGSRIGDGDTVFVHYRYIANPAFDYEMLRQRYGISMQLWDALTVYYSLVRTTQDLLDGDPPPDLTDITTHAAGGEYRWKWSRTSLDWKDEYSSHNGSEDWIAREIVTLWPGENNFLQFSGSYSQTRTKSSGDSEISRALSATYERKLSARSRLLIEGSVIDIYGDTQDSTDTEFLSEYRLYYRIWELTLRYVFRNERDNDIGQVFRNHYFLFELKRNLF